MVGGNTRAGGGARKAGGPRGRPRHCNGQYSSTRTPLAAGAAGKVSRMARSQETTFVRATFAEPRGRCWWRSGAFLARARYGHSSGRSVRFDLSLAPRVTALVDRALPRRVQESG